MNMTDLLDAFVALLRAALSCSVEKYYRPEPPEALTVYVEPLDEGTEQALSIANVFGEPLSLSVITECPWEGTATAGDSVVTTVEVIKAQVHTNRDLAGGVRGYHAGTHYRIGERPQVPGTQQGSLYRVATTMVTYFNQEN